MADSTNVADMKARIMNTLRSNGSMFTAEVAKAIGRTPATASKYLGVLEAEGKVKKELRTPYVNWTVKSGKA